LLVLVVGLMGWSTKERERKKTCSSTIQPKIVLIS
jgi:hypothetical protein